MNGGMWYALTIKVYMGHDLAKCRNVTGRRVWVPRQTAPSTVTNRNISVVAPVITSTANDDFQPVTNPSRRVLSRPVSVNTVNHFQAMEMDVNARDEMEGDTQVHVSGGGDSSGCN